MIFAPRLSPVPPHMHQPMHRHAPAPLLVIPALSNTRRCSCQVAAARSGRLCSGTHTTLPSSSTKISSPQLSRPGLNPYTGPSATSQTTLFFGDLPLLGPSSSSSAMASTQPRTGQQICPVCSADVLLPPLQCFPRQCFLLCEAKIVLRSSNQQRHQSQVQTAAAAVAISRRALRRGHNQSRPAAAAQTLPGSDRARTSALGTKESASSTHSKILLMVDAAAAATAAFLTLGRKSGAGTKKSP